MKKIFLLVFLAIPSVLAALDPTENGDLIVAWQPPDQGNPLDHYIWTYTINGVDDSIIGWSSAQTTAESSAVLTNVGDWAVFKIRAISTLSDTSIQAISDTAILLETQGIDSHDQESVLQPRGFRIEAYPNPAGQSGLTLRWHVQQDDYYAVEVFDVLGAKLKTVRRELMKKGDYSQRVGSKLAAGVYFAIINNYSERRIIKFTIVR